MLKALNDFFSTLHTKVEIVKDLKEIYGKTLANDFNSLDFWPIGENKVSEILGYFLDPNQNHGQKDIYLQLFIKKFQLDFTYLDSSKVKIICEKKTDNNRRLDIYIDYNNGQKLIGIENKIDLKTKDQYKQIEDYIEHLKTHNRQGFYLFYLAPKGKELSQYSLSKESQKNYIEANNLILINYEDHIIDLLHEFAIHSENERVRSFLLDFEKKITKMYIGENDLNDSNIVKNFINDSNVNIELAFKVVSSMKSIKDDMKLKLLDQMEDLATDLNIKFIRNRQRFLLPNLLDYEFTLSYELGGIIVGLTRTVVDVNKPRLPKVEALFDDKFSVSPWWALYRLVYSSIENQPSFWIDINNGVFKEKIRNYLKTILNKETKDLL